MRDMYPQSIENNSQTTTHVDLAPDPKKEPYQKPADCIMSDKCFGAGCPQVLEIAEQAGKSSREFHNPVTTAGMELAATAVSAMTRGCSGPEAKGDGTKVCRSPQMDFEK